MFCVSFSLLLVLFRVLLLSFEFVLRLLGLSEVCVFSLICAPFFDCWFYCCCLCGLRGVLFRGLRVVAFLFAYLPWVYFVILFYVRCMCFLDFGCWFVVGVFMGLVLLNEFRYNYFGVVCVLFGCYFEDLVGFAWLLECLCLVLLVFNVTPLRFGFDWLFWVFWLWF